MNRDHLEHLQTLEHLQILEHLQVPGPTITALTQPFWRAVSECELEIQQCQSCHKHIFYPRSQCPFCWGEDLQWQRVTGSGTLKSYSQVNKPGHPGWIDITPYYVGLIELNEGPTLLSYLFRTKKDMQIGDRFKFEPTNLGGRILPCFEQV
ncbi:Zn-ribbon domain-containing OB-fold protein [Vibrio penaeicida]|uniref:Zn-ribbon domain-containing OB-fold protein n=1 Tax=Vibrio penaeicida TaxID=104609 RepID=UPI000CE9E7E3|nr:OB-fold domain-containing protein [Vibrio penaeicida]